MNLTERVGVHAALADPHRLAIVDAVALGDLTPSQLGRMLDTPSNLLAHHLDVLESAGVVERRRSEGDRRMRYVVLRRGVLGALGVSPPVRVRQPLFVCTKNSARSQFAASLWAARAGRSVESAGTSPASGVDPTARRVAREFGIDLTGCTPRAVSAVTVAPDLVVSVCDRAGEQELPFAARRLHWSVPDPVGDGRVVAFRMAFGEIVRRVDALVAAAGST